ncbi:MAG: hypothetical protein U5O69_04030 [Candidatus Competibacteraceae bacterium]|nr:hypothetical protein [Candidatus Competibacteraceae bacterium]
MLRADLAVLAVTFKHAWKAFSVIQVAGIRTGTDDTCLFLGLGKLIILISGCGDTTHLSEAIKEEVDKRRCY